MVIVNSKHETRSPALKVPDNSDLSSGNRVKGPRVSSDLSTATYYNVQTVPPGATARIQCLGTGQVPMPSTLLSGHKGSRRHEI